MGKYEFIIYKLETKGGRCPPHLKLLFLYYIINHILNISINSTLTLLFNTSKLRRLTRHMLWLLSIQYNSTTMLFLRPSLQSNQKLAHQSQLLFRNIHLFPPINLFIMLLKLPRQKIFSPYIPLQNQRISVYNSFMAILPG